MKNKIIAAVMTGAVVLQSGFCAMAEETQIVYDKNDRIVMDFIDSMGFAKVLKEENEDITPEAKITRAEFAVVLSEVCGLDVLGKGENYFDEIFSNEDKDEQLITDAGVRSCYNDIDQSHWAYDYVERVKNYGLMVGVDNRSFAPDRPVTVNEAVKVLETALNYSVMADMYGGYPQGYIKIAKDIKLLKNVSASVNDELDWLSAQHLFYNALHTTVLKPKGSGTTLSYTDKNSKMLLTELFDIDVFEGIVRDNGVSSLTSFGIVGEKQVKIDDTYLYYTEDSKAVRDLLGHSAVVYYYNEDAENSYQIVYSDCAEKEEEITFSSVDFDSINSSYISYYVNDKARKTKLSKTPYVIINGEAVSEWDKSIFDGNDTEVELICWDGESANVISVTRKEYAFPEKVNAENEIIYNKLRTNNADNINVMDLSGYQRVTIIGEDGAEGTIASIKAKDVLEVVRGARSITITISGKLVEDFVIKNVTTDENERKIVSNGENAYVVVSAYEDSVEKSELKSGKTYTLYLNSRDELVWAEAVIVKGENIAGILTKVGKNDELDEEAWYIKAYTGNKEIDRYYLKDKISLNGKRVKTEEKTEEIDDYYDALILFKVDEANKVTAITTPADYGDRSDRGLYRMNVPGKKLNYHIQTAGLGLNMFINGSTVKFTAPVNEELREDVSAYALGQAGFSDNTGYLVDGYTTTLDSLNAEYIVAKQEVKSGTYDSKCMVIDSVSETINEDDEPCYKITGYVAKYETAVSYKEFMVEPDVKFIDVEANDVDGMTVEDLARGDIIRYNVNQKDNINTIFRVYDFTNDTLSPRKASNGNQFTRGWAYSYGNGYLRISGSNVKPENVDFSKVGNDESNDDLKGYRAADTKIVVIDTSKKKAQVSQGTSADITTYIDTMTPNNYSKVIVMSEWTFNAYLIAVYN